MFSPNVSDLWNENTFFLILFSRREWVGNLNQSKFPVPVVQLSLNFLHMVLNSLPRYHAKNFLIVSPSVYFLVYALIKIPPLAEIPSWNGRRELPIGHYTVVIQFLCLMDVVINRLAFVAGLDGRGRRRATWMTAPRHPPYPSTGTPPSSTRPAAKSRLLRRQELIYQSSSCSSKLNFFMLI